MGESAGQLVLVGILVAVNAAFAGTELALVSLRDSQLARLESRGRAGRALVQLARDPNQFLATIQVGITLAGFLASATAAVSLAEPVEEWIDPLGGAARPVSIVVVTLVLSYLTLVLGELAPKRLAMQRAEGWALTAARPLSALATAARPAVWLLSRSTDLVVRLVGGNPEARADDVSEEELRDLIAMRTSFTPYQRSIIEGTFEAAGRTLRAVMRPRPDVVSVDASLPCDEAVRMLSDTGHTRAPVTAPEGDLDDVVGVVHLRALLGGGDEPVERRATDALFLPESVEVLEALRRMQADRQHLAVVVSEHGGTEGIVTIEDLLEEIVGEIYDETDREVLSVQRLPDGSLLLPGRFPVHDLVDVGVEVPTGEYTTIAGAVLDRLGRIPDRPGDRVRLGEWTVEVVAVAGRTVTLVRLRPGWTEPR